MLTVKFTFLTVAVVSTAAALECWTKLEVISGIFSREGKTFGMNKCGAAETHCGKASGMAMTTFMSLDGVRNTTGVLEWLKGKTGLIEYGYVCMSDADCSTAGASTLASCADMRGACCCTGEKCSRGTTDDAQSSFSFFSYLAVIASLLLIRL